MSDGGIGWGCCLRLCLLCVVVFVAFFGCGVCVTFSLIVGAHLALGAETTLLLVWRGLLGIGSSRDGGGHLHSFEIEYLSCPFLFGWFRLCLTCALYFLAVVWTGSWGAVRERVLLGIFKSWSCVLAGEVMSVVIICLLCDGYWVSFYWVCLVR